MSAGELLGHGIADRIGDIDGAGARLDRALDGAAEEIMLAARAVLARPFDVVAEIARVADAVDHRLMHRLGLHLQLVLHVQRRGRDEGVDARPGGVLHRFPAAVDVAPAGARQAADGRVLDQLGDLAHRLEIAVGGDREAGLDHVDAHLLEEQRDLDLLLEIHRGARRLLAVAQGGVENDDAVAAVDVTWPGRGLAVVLRWRSWRGSSRVGSDERCRFGESPLTASRHRRACPRSGAGKSQPSLAPPQAAATVEDARRPDPAPLRPILAARCPTLNHVPVISPRIALACAFSLKEPLIDAIFRAKHAYL